jgi:hypothetical protein
MKLFRGNRFVLVAIVILTGVLCYGIKTNQKMPVIHTPETTPLLTPVNDSVTVSADVTVSEFSPLEVNRYYNDSALFLAGMGLNVDSDLFQLTSYPEYQRYVADSGKQWLSFDTKITARIRKWADSEVPDILACHEVFYPFGGPDILHARIFFPEATQYTLLGLEPVGAIPELGNMDADSLTAYISALDRSIANVLRLSFFVTKDMKNDLPQIDGILPIIMLFLARTGSDIIDIRFVQIDPEGKLIYLADYGLNVPRKHNPGVEITFKDKGAEIVRTVRYFSADLSDESLISLNRMKIYLNSMENGYVTFLKASSYLMHTDSFDTIREIILDKSKYIVQDDSGIAYHDFNNGMWDISLYGTYTGPIESFQHQFEKDLMSAYEKKAKPLRFRIGYGTKSNLLVAKRIRN